MPQYDPNTGKMISELTASSYLSPGDIQRAQKAGWKDAAIAGGLGAAAQLGQTALTFIDTPQDVYNRERMAELDKHKGLTQGDRADIDERAMRGVRALSTQNRALAEAQLAGSGGHSAGDIARVRRDSEKNTNDAAIQAADIGIQANREQVKSDIAEEERRRAFESNKQRDRIESLGATLSGLASTLTPALASQAAMREPTDSELIAMQRATTGSGDAAYPGVQGMSVADMRAWWAANAKAPSRREGAPVVGAPVPAGYAQGMDQ